MLMVLSELIKMPPSLKLVVTSEHEEALWERKFLNTDTSMGLIQAVIFYLIKCFGLWQGKDLKLLKTEHVSFNQDNIGLFVSVDIRTAMGTGKVIKRYDDQDNPRSVYKILKTYKGYLANEGPFLVRPISSIKDYICYSPWPLGVNVIEQTVVNLMQECGAGSGFGNISVCLMAIDILKSYGAGSHCISTWMFRLYPRYKKTFWADMFKRCCAINCEDKNQEVCLMISHVLDPPYPAASMLVEMRMKQKMMKNKVDTVNSQRTQVFNSWLLNLNCKKGKEHARSLKQGSGQLSSHGNKASHMTKSQNITESRTKKIKKPQVQNASVGNISSDLHFQLSVPASLHEPSEITVKTELMSDLDSSENKSVNSDVRIMTVLSIPESAYSAQIDESECTANENTITSPEASKKISADKLGHSSLKTKNVAVKRKLQLSKEFITSPKNKQSNIYIKIEEMEGSDLSEREQILNRRCESNSGVDNQSESCLISLNSGVKVELDVDCDDFIPAEQEDSLIIDFNDESQKFNGGQNGNKLCIQDVNDGVNLSTSGNSNCSLNPQFNINNLQKNYIKSESTWNDLPQDVSTQKREYNFAHVLKATNRMLNTELLPLTSSAYSCQNISSCSFENTDTSTKTRCNQLHHESDSSIYVTASSACNQLDCASKTVCSLNDSWRKINQTKCLTKNLCDKEEVELKANDSSYVSSPCKEILNVDNSHKICVNASICADVSPRTVKHCEHSDEGLTILDNMRNLHHCNSDGQLATDIVKFLNAAHKQLQNILQTSAASSNLNCIGNDRVLHGSLPPSYDSSQQSHGFSQPSHDSQSSSESLQPLHVSKLKRRPRFKKTNTSGIRAKTNIISNLKTNLVRLRQGHRCEVLSSMVTSNLQKPAEFGCILEELRRPLLRRKASDLISRNISHAAISSQDKNRCVTIRSEHPHNLQTELESDNVDRKLYHNHPKKKLFCSSMKQARISKKQSFLKRCSNKRTAFTSGKTAYCCNLDQRKCSETIQSHSGTNSDYSSPTNTMSETSPSSSLLAETTANSDNRSGIYHCRSNHHDNAVYQTLHINQEKRGTQTFTICDLPLQGSEKSGYNSQSSEICLGDYFPEGTVIPARGVKLLTKQSACGLEVILKFDFNVDENSKLKVDKSSEYTKEELNIGTKLGLNEIQS